jgi:hypothetical protein
MKTQALYRSRVVGSMANHMGYVELVVWKEKKFRGEHEDKHDIVSFDVCENNWMSHLMSQ